MYLAFILLRSGQNVYRIYVFPAPINSISESKILLSNTTKICYTLPQQDLLFANFVTIQSCYLHSQNIT